ncbi:MAG: hypothetical protein V2J07_02865 [Anaerolineae bacterium]|jgi:hypothetical protein|nr:hypothetical protein [Anaerolineae bacterium]
MMKKNRLVVLPLLVVALMLSMACSLLEQLTAPQASVPTLEPGPPIQEPTQPQSEPEATATAAPEPTALPTETPPNHGQIVYIAGGNVWRYLIDRAENLQLTFDGVADSYEGSYGNPLLSTDGRYVSYTKNGVSYLHNLEDNSFVTLPVLIFQWSQSRPASFYASQGNFMCPEIENLEEQTAINFDLLRYDVADLAAPALIANIGGGLKFPQAISDNEQYISLLYCACYSECGNYVIHQLPSNTPLSAPPDVYAGAVDFSPDSSRLVTSQWQLYGYAESPLYLANSDFSGAITLYSAPQVAVVHPRWSPDGGWVAFTAYDIAEEFELSDKRVLLTNLDGSVLQEIADGNAEFSTWSPDGSQLLFYRGEWGAFSLFLHDLLSGSTTALPITASTVEIDWGVLP